MVAVTNQIIQSILRHYKSAQRALTLQIRNKMFAQKLTTNCRRAAHICPSYGLSANVKKTETMEMHRKCRSTAPCHQLNQYFKTNVLKSYNFINWNYCVVVRTVFKKPLPHSRFAVTWDHALNDPINCRWTASAEFKKITKISWSEQGRNSLKKLKCWVFCLMLRFSRGLLCCDFVFVVFWAFIN